MHQVISGGGGAKLRELTPDPRTVFARTMYGYTVLEVGQERIHLEMFDQKGQKVHEADILPPAKPDTAGVMRGEGTSALATVR
jgi:hypothetical protein